MTDQARVIMVEGQPWVSHEFHQRFIAELRAENDRLRLAMTTIARPGETFGLSDKLCRSIAQAVLAESRAPSDEILPSEEKS